MLKTLANPYPLAEIQDMDLHKAISELQEDLKFTVLMYMAVYRFNEIAEFSGTSRSAVSYRWKRAMLCLRKSMQEHK